MICKECGEKMYALNTRLSKDGIFTRYRECRNCLNRIVTVEIERDEYRRLIQPEAVERLIEKYREQSESGVEA